MKKLLTTLIIAGSLFFGTTHAAQTGWFNISGWLGSSQQATTVITASPVTPQVSQHDSNFKIHETGILGAQATALICLATSEHSEKFRNAFYAFATDNPALTILGTSVACLIIKSFLDEFNKGLAHITTRIQKHTHPVVKDNSKLALGLLLGGLIFKPFIMGSK